MGEIAEMMVEGILCNCCGEYLGEDAGYPRLCAACSGDHDEPRPIRKAAAKRKVCQQCGRTFVHAGALGQHIGAMRRNGTHK